MRTRTRTINIEPTSFPTTTYPRVEYNCADVPILFTTQAVSSTISTYNYKVERIEDAKPTDHNNPVWHRSMQVITSDDPVPTNYTGGVNGGGYYVLTSGGAVHKLSRFNNLEYWAKGFNLDRTLTGYPSPKGWVIDKSGINESALIEDCFERANQLKADHLLNIVEANKMWPTIKELALSLPRIAAAWGAVGYSPTATLKEAASIAANATLAWKFGIKPVLQDIGATMRYLPKLAEDIQRVKDGDTWRYSRVATCKASYTPLLYADNVQAIKGKGSIMDQPVIRYVLVVKPNSTNYHTDFFKKLDVMTSRFATSPASLAWELTKFSFVVDWFVDLRGVLRAIDNLLGVAPFKVIAFSRSHSYRLRTDIEQFDTKGCVGHATLLDQNSGSVVFSHYERSPVSQSATWPTWKPHFGKSQAAVSAALITQQLSRLRK